MRAEQTVMEMVVESLARQAQALSDNTERPFEEAFAQVLKTPAGRRLAELADGPHRHEKAAEWQAGLLADREAQRPAHLRTSRGGHEVGESRLSWLGRFPSPPKECVEGASANFGHRVLFRRPMGIDANASQGTDR